MRISDWSSDVCSSDLGEGAGSQDGSHGRAPIGVEGKRATTGCVWCGRRKWEWGMGNDTARRSACPAPDRDCAEELAPAIVSRQAAPRPRYAAHAPPPLHAAMCGMPAGFAVHRLRVDTLASRSEEHTSE